MNRISRPYMFMEMAEVAAKRSTCFRANVGAVIVRDRDIVCMGYNGSPPGEHHCLGNDCPQHNGGCIISVHAEWNAISRAATKLNGELGDCDLYCTYTSCESCAQLILDYRIPRFFFRQRYRKPEGLAMLIGGGVEVFKVTPSGTIVNDRTKEIIDPETIPSVPFRF